MLEYRIALTNVWWSKGDINCRFFENIDQQSAYFDKLVGGLTSPLTNFNMGNNVETMITYLDTTNKSIEELVASNYAVIYKIEDNIIKNRRYFFAYPMQDSGRQMRVSLSLDDIQTNYFKVKNKIATCNIKRACLNRFKNIGWNYVAFNDELTLDNHLFEEENLTNFPKRVVERYSITPTPDTNKASALSNWFRDNILGWQYIFLDSTHSFSIVNSDLTNGSIKFGIKYGKSILKSIDGAVGCICCPIYKSDKIIKGKILINDTEHNIDFSTNSLSTFKATNNDASYFFANKFSILPPFKVSSFSNYSIDNAGNLVFDVSGGGQISYVDNGIVFFSYNDVGNLHGLFNVNFQSIEEEISDYLTLPVNFSFSRGEIINSLKDYKFNPKMLGSKYIEIKITNGNGEKFSYNLQKLGTNNLTLKYKEALTPDITRSMFFIENGLYNRKNAEAYLGLINSFDNSLMQSNDQLQQFLAQNKNFHSQKLIQYASQASQSIVRAGMSALGGNLGGAEADLWGSFANISADAINTQKTLDNLENAPDMLKNANGNAIFNLMASGQNLIVELYDSLPSEKEEANDFMVQFGFTYNHDDKVENVDNIRKRFNYFEADVEVIDYPISLIEKERLKDCLKSIRFWNSDKIDYSLENYERWLENA